MKMHVATDDIIGIVTNAVYGPANEHDISRARELIPSETEQVYGDAGYVGMGNARNSRPIRKQKSARTGSTCGLEF